MEDWSAGDWLLVIVKTTVILAALVWIFKVILSTSGAPRGERWCYFKNGRGQEFPPVFAVFFAVVLITWAVTELGHAPPLRNRLGRPV